MSSQADGYDVDDEDYPPTHWFLRFGFWSPRLGGSITVVCSAWMIVMAWNRRDHIFHRLVLGAFNHVFLVLSCLRDPRYSRAL